MNAFFASLSSTARIGLIAGVALIVVATVAAFFALSQPNFGVLFSDLRDSDAAAISKQLDDWKVPYQILDQGHTLSVPPDQVLSTRLRLVSAGVPSGGRVGFELFKDSNFGITEFAQRVNFQRALQGELERTIASFDAVEQVRVHLNLSEAGGLLARDPVKKASVALSFRPGQSLGTDQVQGIRNLIAAAVEGLSADNVVVLDASGMPMGTDETNVGPHAFAARMSEQAQLEAHIRARAIGLLQRVFPDGEFDVAVDAQLNMDQVSVQTEQVRPQGSDGASLIVREKRSGQPSNAGQNAPAARTPLQTEVEYQHGRQVEQVVPAPGRVEKLSVAILVPTSVDEERVIKVKALIAAAVGLNVQRGDQIEVAALIEGAAQTRASAAEEIESASPTLPPSISPTTPQPRLLTWVLGSIAAGGALLVGILLGRSSRPRTLSRVERERGLAQIRTWLAHEGSSA